MFRHTGWDMPNVLVYNTQCELVIRWDHGLNGYLGMENPHTKLITIGEHKME